MKIGLIIYGSLDTLSGGYLYDRQLVEYLRGQGDIVEVISLPWRNYAAHLTDNLTFRLPTGLDILIQDELNHPSLLAANQGKHPYPIISLVHHLRCSEQRPAWQNFFYRLVEVRYLRSVDGFIFNSQTTRNVVSPWIDDAKPSIIAYPPTDRFGAGLPEQAIIERAQKHPLRILFLGNLIPRKGVHTLLDALAHLPSLSSFTLDIVGSLSVDAAYAHAMQKKAAQLGLTSQVTFHGSLNNAPLVEKLSQAHVLVVPSSYEGFGIVYLEGMAFGLPAIGTTAGAAHEIITAGQTGFLIRPGDAQTLAAHLHALATDRTLLTRMSLHARERYHRQPKWEQTAGEIRNFLLKMASR
ncbi:MAG: glycosyltransferase family 1 protein [Anaerolineae bacterium]|nr:MAG: glycosyltransferase family 1 protein [Anaerolineae bacterium]